MKLFFTLAMFAFSFVPFVPFVGALDKETHEAVDYILKLSPFYCAVGVLGMLAMMYLGEKREKNLRA